MEKDLRSLSASEQPFHVSLSCEVNFVSLHQQQISYWHDCSRPAVLPASRAAFICADEVININPLHGVAERMTDSARRDAVSIGR